jgi:PhnB protein
MSPAHKPEGYTSVSPYLVVDGAQHVIDFLRQVFGAAELRRFDADGGGIMHAEVQIDDSVVMIADSTPDWPPYPSHLHVYVPDVDATYRRALDAGGVAIKEPQRMEGDPDRRGGFTDPAGNSWWVSTQQA